jgi:MFS transporter, DHA2 family, multidrug resistance protein
MSVLALPRARVIDPYAHRYIIAITVALASTLEILDTSIVNVAIPHMMSSLGATLDQIAWVSTGYIVANVIILPITGWLAARIGRRRYFAGSIALFTIASFGCGNSHSLGVLVAWRIVQGLGGGALLSTSQAILYEVFPPAEYGTAMAIFGLGVMVGPTLGPTLGGTITDALSWPWIFYINIPLGIMTFFGTLAFIHDSRQARKAGPVDYPGLLLLIVGVGALQMMLERGERQEWFASREIVILAILSAVGIIGLLWREITTEHPIIDLRVLKNRQFTMGMIFAGALGLGLYATIFVLPVYLQNLQGFTAHETGMVILPGALASAAVMVVLGRTTGKFDPRLSVTVGAGLYFIAMWMMSHFTTQSGMPDYFWPLILRGAGLGMVFVPMTNLALAQLRMDQIPQATGLYNLMRQMGGSFGIAIAATLLTRFVAWNRAALAEHVSLYDRVTRERLQALSAHFAASGAPLAEAQARALAVVDLQVSRQAMMLSFERLFLMFAVVMLLALPVLLLMRPGTIRRGGGAGAH